MAVAALGRPASGINGFASATSITPNSDFGGGLVVGQLYIAWAHVLVAGQTVNVSGTGWSIIDRVADVASGCLAWMVYSGTEASAPTFSWLSAGVVRAGNSSWSGQAASPIGHFRHVVGTGPNIPLGAVTETATLGAFLSVTGTGPLNTPSTPPNYTSMDSGADVGASENVCYELLICDVANATITSATYVGFLVEILGQGGVAIPPTPDAHVNTVIIRKIVRSIGY